MMNNKGKIAAAKMVSLMERMEHKPTYFSAMLNESEMINEATRVSADSFLEFLTRNMIHKGPFVQLGYIQLYPTNSVYPNDDVYKSFSDTRDSIEDNGRNLARFDAHMDKMTNSEWDNPTGRGTRAGKPMANKLYPYVLKLTNYTIHWQDYNKYSEKSGAAAKNLADMKGKMSDNLKSLIFRQQSASNDSDQHGYYPMGDLGNYDIMTFGTKDADGNYTPTNQEYRTDPDDPNSTVSYERTAIRNFMTDITPQKPTYFGVDENGNIDPIPVPLGKLLYNVSSNHDSALAKVSDPVEQQQAKEYFSAFDKNQMAEKTWLMHNVAYVCGTTTEIGEQGKSSKYWVNKNPLFLLKKEKTVNKVKTSFKYLYNNISNDQLQDILDRYARSKADELNAMGNANIQGQTMYANPNDLTL